MNNSITNQKLLEFIVDKELVNEEWREIKGTNNKYFISNKGNVISMYRNKPIVLKPFNCNNYLTVKIKGKNYRIHRLVATTFIDNPNNLPVVHHKDHNRKNNNVNNLEWTTQQKNILEYYKFRKGERIKKLESAAAINLTA